MVNWFSSRLQILRCNENGDEKISTVMEIGDGEFSVGMGMKNSYKDGMRIGKVLWGWGQFYLPCHSLHLNTNKLLTMPQPDGSIQGC